LPLRLFSRPSLMPQALIPTERVGLDLDRFRFDYLYHNM
jgi:hypothetical protein